MSGLYNQTETVNNIAFAALSLIFAVFSYFALKFGINSDYIGTVIPLFHIIFLLLLPFGPCLYGLFSKNSIKSALLGIMFPIIFGMMMISLDIFSLALTNELFKAIFILLAAACFSNIIGWFAASKNIKEEKNKGILILFVIMYPSILFIYYLFFM